MTYAAGGIFDVTFASRDQMYVAVKDGLPCDFAIVHTDVESLHARVRLLDRLEGTPGRQNGLFLNK